MTLTPLDGTKAALSVYGLQGTLLLLGASYFHVVVTGALMKPYINTYQAIEDYIDIDSDENQTKR